MRFLFAALFIAVLGSACSLSDTKSAADESAREVSIPGENLKFVQLDVRGMTCEGCENTVVTSIRKLEGIQEAKASHTDQETTVRFDSTKCSVEEISRAITEAGYKVEGLKTGDL